MYRTVNTKIWKNSKFRRLSAHAQLLYLYTFQSAHSNVSGLYFLPTEYICADLNLSSTDVEIAFKQLQEHELAIREDGWILVCAMFRYQGNFPKASVTAQAAHDECQSKWLREIFRTLYPGTVEEREDSKIGIFDTLTPGCPVGVDRVSSGSGVGQDTHPCNGNGNGNVYENGNGEENIKSQKIAPCNLATPAEAEPPATSRSDKVTDEDRSLASFFLEVVKEIAPSAKMGKSWADDMRLMRERDGHEPQAIRSMIEFVSQDEFWRANILSPSKLRKQWVQLEAKRNAQALQVPKETRGQEMSRRMREMAEESEVIEHG